MRILFAGMFLFLSACGYHPPGSTDSWVGGEAKTVHVRLFENNASEPYLDHYLTEAVVDELSGASMFMLTEDSDSADLQLVGSIDSFTSSAISYSAADRISDYLAEMKVSVSLWNTREDRVVWKDNLVETEKYLANIDKNTQLDGRRRAAKIIARRISETLNSHLLQNF